MAKAFIANKAVRFDRNYKVGEIIPEEVVAPGMRRKLAEMGRISPIDVPDSAETATASADDAGEVSAQPQAENAPEGTETATENAEYICPVCGKTFKTKSALASHSRTHKE